MDKFNQKYKKIKAIGQGAFGKIFLVENRYKEYLAVVKVVDTSKLREEEKSFVLNEIGIMEKLRHPYVVRMYDHLILNNSMAIVMQYAEGGNLEDKIQARKGKLFPKELYFKWIAQLLCGMHYIHENNIIHRDIKSQNIFLTKDDDILIGDFGVSKADQMCETMIGTPLYYSPEMITGQTYTKKADIWSLGVLFYEIVSLKFPFVTESFSPMALGIKITKGQYAELPSAIDSQVKTMIKLMLSVNPIQRPSLLTLMGYSFAKEVLIAEGTVPAGLNLTNDSIKSPTKQSSTMGAGTTKSIQSLQKSPSKGSLGSSSSKGSFQNTNSPYSTATSKKSLPNYHSAQPVKSEPKSKFAEAAEHKSGKIIKPDGVNLQEPVHAASASPVKSRHHDVQPVPALKIYPKELEGQQDKDLFDLLYHCKKVDMKVGLDPLANNKNAAKEKVFLVENESEEMGHFPKSGKGKFPDKDENLFTEQDLQVEVSEVIDHRVIGRSSYEGPTNMKGLVRDKQEIDVASILTVETQNKAQE